MQKYKNKTTEPLNLLAEQNITKLLYTYAIKIKKKLKENVFGKI